MRIPAPSGREAALLEDRERAHERISAAIAQIDRLILAQVEAILHAPEFRRVEAAWRSLAYLVAQKPRDKQIRLRVLNVSRQDILDDLEDAIEFDRSTLFNLVYEQEYGLFGGHPYTALALDFEFLNDPEDVAILRGLSGIAAAAHAVLLAGAAPGLLGLERWTELAPHAVPADLETPAHAAWNSLRRMPDARYLGLVLPRILLRAPYRPGDPDRILRLREDVSAPDGAGFLWGNGAFGLATRLMQAFHDYGWCTAIRGLRDGCGVVGGLPRVCCTTDAKGLIEAPPVEVVVTESEEKAIADLGLVPLVRVAGGPTVAFFAVPSLHLPQRVDDALVTANLKLSAQLPYMLAASRFAHYLKVIMRDRTGRPATPTEVQLQLSSWLSRHTLATDASSKEMQARYPLRAFDVQVRERRGRPGHLEAILQLQPHYQIEDPGVSLNLAVDLPEPVKGRA